MHESRQFFSKKGKRLREDLVKRGICFKPPFQRLLNYVNWLYLFVGADSLTPSIPLNFRIWFLCPNHDSFISSLKYILNIICVFPSFLQKLTVDTTVADIRGREIQAVKVFTHAIRYLKDHLLDSQKPKGKIVKNDDILWVLTVPAIWDDTAKLFMRKAAQEVSKAKNQRRII